jgi:hypothetical protein
MSKTTVGYALGGVLVLVVMIFFWMTRPAAVAGHAASDKELGGGSRILSFDANQRLLVAGHSPWLATMGQQESSQHNGGIAKSAGAAPAEAANGAKVGDASFPFQTICAEPSPDALTDISGDASLDYKEKLLDMLNRYGTKGQNIGVRTPSVQVLRDSMYRLCEAFSAGGLSPITYAMLMQQFQTIMVGLLAIEDLTSGLSYSAEVDSPAHEGLPTPPDGVKGIGARSKSGKDAPADERSASSAHTSKAGHRAVASLTDRAQISDAVRLIVKYTLNGHRRSNFCMAVLSFPLEGPVTDVCIKYLFRGKLPDEDEAEPDEVPAASTGETAVIQPSSADKPLKQQ